MRIQELCSREWEVLIKQIPREVNFDFDTLVDLMKGFPIGARIFHVAPPLVDDQIGIDGHFLLSNADPTISS